MKSLLALTCLLLAGQLSIAQKNFQPATVITFGGETQSGEIDYKNWKENPSTILFRKNKSSEVVKYGINDLREFKVSNDQYKRGVVEVFERSNNSLNYHDSDTMIGHLDTVFLLAVVSGPKSLYQYTDNVDHFYIPHGEGFEFLRFNKYKVTKEVLIPEANYSATNQKFIATNKTYITQLKEYLKECASLNNADDIAYEINSLRDVFSLYYSCMGQNPDFILKPEKEKLEISVLAGASVTSFNVNTANDFSLLGRADYSKSTNAAAGVSFDLVFPRKRGRVSFNNELMYTSYSTTGYLKVTTNPSVTDEFTYDFAFSYIKVNTMLRYKFFMNNTVLYVNGGISNGIRVSETNKETQVHAFQDDKQVTTKKAFQNTRGHELGYIAGVGVKVKKASFELRAEKGNGPFNATGYRANVMRFFALIGYRLR